MNKQNKNKMKSQNLESIRVEFQEIINDLSGVIIPYTREEVIPRLKELSTQTKLLGPDGKKLSKEINIILEKVNKEMEIETETNEIEEDDSKSHSYNLITKIEDRETVDFPGPQPKEKEILTKKGEKIKIKYFPPGKHPTIKQTKSDKLIFRKPTPSKNKSDYSILEKITSGINIRKTGKGKSGKGFRHIKPK